MIARYDLQYELTTFDFYCWLVIEAAKGAKEIVFGTKAYRESIFAPDVMRRRFESIIAPGPALLGLPCREGDNGERNPDPCKFKHLVAFARNQNLPRLRSVLPPGSARYTVTLRKQTRKSPYRNSNEAAWRTFAAEIGAKVIEDFDIYPIGLHERVALYAGAEMNFGVASGPMVMATLTDYPCMSFDWGKGPQANVLQKCGLAHGDHMPWCGKNQMTFWQPDDLGTIRARFQEWRASLA